MIKWLEVRDHLDGPYQEATRSAGAGGICYQADFMICMSLMLMTALQM